MIGLENIKANPLPRKRGGGWGWGFLLLYTDFQKTERVGFEPTLRLLPNSISSAAPSTTRPPIQVLQAFILQ